MWPSQPLTLLYVKDTIISEHCVRFSIGSIVLGFQYFPEHDRARLLTFPDFATHRIDLLHRQEVRTGVSQHVQQEYIHAPVVLLGYQVLRHPTEIIFEDGCDVESSQAIYLAVKRMATRIGLPLETRPRGRPPNRPADSDPNGSSN